MFSFHKPPRFLHGHNQRGAVRAPERHIIQKCACGCGDEASPGKRFVSGHNSVGRRISEDTRARLAASKIGSLNHRYGKQPANYLGRVKKTTGYIKVVVPDHPFSTRLGHYVMDHRLIVERHLRQLEPDSPFLTNVDGVLYLRPHLEVHHINGIKDDNRIENLMVLTQSEHSILHYRLKEEARKSIL